jgi:hypothetical protein
MMKKRDYIPQAYDKLLEWTKSFVAYLKQEGIMSRLGLPQAILVLLETLLSAYEAACNKADASTASSVDRAYRKRKAAELRRAIRNCVNQSIRYNDNVTNEDREGLKLTIPDSTRTATKRPHMFPVAEDIKQPAKAHIEVKYIDSETHKSSKPEGVHGIETTYYVGAAPVEHIRELNHSLFATHNPTYIDLTDEESGQVLSFASRYENTRGEKGPWSPIYHVIVS